jgi:hypothetical protein
VPEQQFEGLELSEVCSPVECGLSLEIGDEDVIAGVEHELEDPRVSIGGGNDEGGVAVVITGVLVAFGEQTLDCPRVVGEEGEHEGSIAIFVLFAKQLGALVGDELDGLQLVLGDREVEDCLTFVVAGCTLFQ